MESRPEMNRFWLRESSLNYKISSLETLLRCLMPSFIPPWKKTDPDTNIGDLGVLSVIPYLGPTEKSQIDLFRRKELPDKCQLIFFDVGKRKIWLRESGSNFFQMRMYTCSLERI